MRFVFSRSGMRAVSHRGPIATSPGSCGSGAKTGSNRPARSCSSSGAPPTAFHPSPSAWTSAEPLKAATSHRPTSILEAGQATRATRPLTDAGNAERFVARNRSVVRYAHGWDSWLVWDGARWARDYHRQVYGLAVKTARAIPRSAIPTESGNWRTVSTRTARCWFVPTAMSPGAAARAFRTRKRPCARRSTACSDECRRWRDQPFTAPAVSPLTR